MMDNLYNDAYSEQINHGNINSVEAAEDTARAYKTRAAYGLISDEEYSSVLYKLLDVVLEDNLTGDSDDWHNFAINFTQRCDYINACKVLDKGIEQHCNSVDLLADYIKYGMQCGKVEKCTIFYEKLANMPSTIMTWRGFDFSIDYLLLLVRQSVSQDEIDVLREKINICIDKFIRRYPYDEQSYLAQAEVFLAFGEFDNAVETLSDVMSKFSAPKCCLKYADLMLPRGNFDEVIRATQLGISYSAQEQAGVNVAYLFYLSALAKDGKLHKEGGDAYFDEARIKDIYLDYMLAEKSFDENRSAYIENINTRTTLLRIKTGIPYKTE